MQWYNDNKSTMSIAHNSIHDRIKHIEIDKYFINYNLDKDLMVTTDITTRIQITNIFIMSLQEFR